jgi:peptidoglycan/xylan/chitin deacetylase (PgdA/CDA1 family)
MAGIRFDRTLTMAVFHPLRRALGEGGFRLPVLMYHAVCDDPEPGVSPYYKVNTSPAVFRRQMRQLSEAGYKTLDLLQATEVLAGRQPVPAGKSVVITFDDGFRCFYTEAWPALREHGFTATAFLATAFIHNARQSFKGRECLTWDEARELRKAGMGLGSHTVNHPILYELSWDRIERELRDSRQRMEKELAGPVTGFAYPYAFPQSDGHFVEAFKKLLDKAGYACCVTTELGRARLGDDPFQIKRLPVNLLDDAKFFRAKLEGGYDWLAWPQAASKNLKERTRAGRRRNDAAAPMEHAPLH